MGFNNLDCHQNDDFFVSANMPQVLGAGIVDQNDGWYMASHSHLFTEIVYIASGSGTFYIEGKKYEAKSGRLFIYSPNTVHQESSAGRIKSYFLQVACFVFKDRGPNCVLPDDAPPVIDLGAHQPFFETCMKDLFHNLEEFGSIYYNIAQCKALHILVYLNSIYNQPAEKRTLDKDSLPILVKQYLDENFKSDITLETLEQVFYMSRYYISHAFTAYAGISPIAYLTSLRVDKAKSYLLSTGWPLKKIGLQVGFKNDAAFIRHFKALTGSTPSKFRELHRMQEKEAATHAQ